MSLIEKLQEDMKLAQKNRDVLRLSTIRLLRSSVSYARIEKGAELTDDEVMTELSRAAKQRRESIEAAERGGREDIAEREKAELAIINEYLPEQLGEAEIEAIARQIASQVGATDPKDRGKLMGPLMQQIKGRADGKLPADLDLFAPGGWGHRLPGGDEGRRVGGAWAPHRAKLDQKVLDGVGLQLHFEFLPRGGKVLTGRQFNGKGDRLADGILQVQQRLAAGEGGSIRKHGRG